MLRSGMAVDASLNSALSSTKNAHDERYPQMKQTKKGHIWYFGMKACIGVDIASGCCKPSCRRALEFAAAAHGFRASTRLGMNVSRRSFTVASSLRRNR